MSSAEEESPRRERMSSEEEEEEEEYETQPSKRAARSPAEGGTKTAAAQSRSSNKRPRDDDEEDGEKDDVAEEDEEEEDEEDEEDDEEDEEDEDDDAARPHRRPRKKRRANMFLDVEAEVDEDEEELEEEDDDLGGEDGFIQEQDLENEEINAGDDRGHRDLDRQRQEITDKDAERLAEEFREKYGRSAASRYRGDGAGIAQRLLLPSVNDPSIWAIKCKTGKEMDIIAQISKRMMTMASRGQSMGITSAFQRDSLQGYIYVEARKAAFVAEAVKDIPNVYAAKLILVPIQEMPDLLRVKQQTIDLVPGSYVRIKTKSSKYAGDLAQVDNVDEDGTHARLRLIPRLDLSGKCDVITPDGKRLKKQMPLSFRPPARLFNEAEVQYFPFNKNVPNISKLNEKNLVTRRGGIVSYNGEEFEYGYLMKDFRIAALTTKDVNPSLEEITKFAGADDSEGIDLTSLAAGIKAASQSSTFEAGDVVEVFEGEQAGVHGSVESVTNDIATIISSYAELKGQRLEVPVRSLRKRFKSGDHVKVANGRYKDDTGMVVRVVDDQVTLLSDISMKEITVFSKDLSEASQGINMNATSKYELHDLVQLDVNTVACIIKVEREAFQVLDQNGTLKTILPRQISMKITNRKSIATDRDGFEIRVGDTVKETQGELRQGSILHIHRSFAFLYNRELNENLGVFAARTSNLATIAARGARINTGPDLNKMNPAMQRRNGPGMMAPPPQAMRTGGFDKAIGQTVIVRQGPYKGLLGIIKDTTDVTARVELHSNLRTVSLEKSKLTFKTPQGNLSYEEFGNRGRGFSRESPTPSPSWGGRTPAAGDFGGRTPAFGGAGGRTPAYKADGGRTPAWHAGGSNKTPAWTGSGSKTPAWGGGAGNKTPAWGPASGSRTPAWGAASGSRTPAWGGRDGGRTPGRREETARTPGASWDNPAKVATPGVWNAPTPGAYAAETPAYTPANFNTNYDTAATPGAQSAPTPGFTGTYNARTPGPSNAAATPGYAPASP